MTPEALRDETIRLLKCVRPLDCGAHYCRYCPAKSPAWEHSPACPYVESQRDHDDAQSLIRALAAQPVPGGQETPHYAGPASEWFWARVNATGDMALYSSACSLQDVEGKVLAALEGHAKASPSRATTPQEVPISAEALAFREAERTAALEEQSALLARYREALESIGNNSCCGPCLEARNVARAALTATDTTG